MRNIEVATYFFLNPANFPTKETFNFKSLWNPPKVEELTNFKADLVKIIENIEFEERPNVFQNQLNAEKSVIEEESRVIVAADKTSNHYAVEVGDYEKLVEKAIHSTYKKESIRNVNKLNASHKAIVNRLDIEDRVFKTSDREAFVTLKDHKPNFSNNAKSRLLNPRKPELGRVSHIILSKIVDTVRVKSKLNQWKNIYSCIEWFKRLDRKKSRTFIVYDIINFYPTITEDLLIRALNWAKKYVSISDEEFDIIFQARKSLLYYKGTYWTKKDSSNFDVSMGSYDGGEVCDICGLFLLSQLVQANLNVSFGSYKDDGLASTTASARQVEKIKKQICQIYQSFGLQVTIEANKKTVQFLDAELCLEKGTYKPFLKPGLSLPICMI